MGRENRGMGKQEIWELENREWGIEKKRIKGIGKQGKETRGIEDKKQVI